MAKLEIEFSTSRYEWAYGHAPRGYGDWGFRFDGLEFWANGKYGEAKRACIKHIKELVSDRQDAFVTVYVLT